ncbi:cutinase-domain-containing protein [Paraphoma chrysanthemicola]|uniref:Cutinase n=1 Tax=Paraphoma chrysanthemicola TaxID=798071 RepID=A0A8K0QS40_9PLEO|nr:cutinase-domain-containing protein [Paraphoma chrysanthemicola]
MPTGLPGSGSGSGFDWSSLIGGGSGSGKAPSLPATTGGGSGFGSGLGSGFDWSSLLNGGGSGLGGTKPVATPTQTGVATVPSQTGSAGGNTGGSGTIGSNCTPQGAGRGSTENGVTTESCCTDMTVIFARGTGETGNVGTVSGPPMFKALRSKLGNDRVKVQGVDYPASAGGNANQGADGGKKMAELVAKALSQCPNTKVIVSGYSQGGMVVHNAFKNGLAASQVSGAVLFGDPLKRSPVGDLPAAKIKQFCGTSDTICGGGGDGGATGGHISYGSSAEAAATFAIQAAGLA